MCVVTCLGVSEWRTSESVATNGNNPCICQKHRSQCLRLLGCFYQFMNEAKYILYLRNINWDSTIYDTWEMRSPLKCINVYTPWTRVYHQTKANKAYWMNRTMAISSFNLHSPVPKAFSTVSNRKEQIPSFSFSLDSSSKKYCTCIKNESFTLLPCSCQILYC